MAWELPLASGKVLRSPPGTGAFLDVSAGSSGVASAAAGDGVVRVFSPDRFREEGVRHFAVSFEPGRGHGIAPDGRTVVACDKQGATAYDVQRGEAVWRVETDCTAGVRFAPDSARVYLRSGRRGVEMVDVASGKRVRLETTPQAPRMAVSPKGRWLVVAGREPVGVLYDARTLSFARNIEFPESPILSLNFASLRLVCVALAADRFCALELPSGNLAWEYAPERGHVTDAAMIDAERTLVSCYDFARASSRFMALETATGRPQRVLVDWSQKVTGTACFPLPGGRTALTNHGHWISLEGGGHLGQFVFLPREQWALWHDGRLLAASEGIDRYFC